MGAFYLGVLMADVVFSRFFEEIVSHFSFWALGYGFFFSFQGKFMGVHLLWIYARCKRELRVVVFLLTCVIFMFLSLYEFFVAIEGSFVTFENC